MLVFYYYIFCLDIKPDNLLLKSPGIIKICDFGLTAKVKDVEEPDLHALGTVRYMSPELMLRNVLLDREDSQASNFIYDYRTDVWSIGIVLLEFLLGSSPLKQLLSSREELFCEYIKNMTKNKPHNRGSGLLQMLVLRPGYKRQLQRARITPIDDKDKLLVRCPKLVAFGQNIENLVDRDHLKDKKVKASLNVPALGANRIYKLNICLDFLAQCLICTYENRPTSSELKQHPFIVAHSNELEKLVPQMQAIQMAYSKYGLRKGIWKRFSASLTLKPLNELLKLKESAKREEIKKFNFVSV